MRTISKIILILGIALVLFLVIINIPFTEKSEIMLEDNVLVFYSQGLGIAGKTTIEILNNGAIGKVKTYINRSWEFEEFDKLTSEELNQLKGTINNNQFTISKTSLLEKYRRNNPSCFDCDISTELIINKNGETIIIEESEEIYAIIEDLNLFRTG